MMRTYSTYDIRTGMTEKLYDVIPHHHLQLLKILHHWTLRNRISSHVDRSVKVDNQSTLDVKLASTIHSTRPCFEEASSSWTKIDQELLFVIHGRRDFQQKYHKIMHWPNTKKNNSKSRSASKWRLSHRGRTNNPLGLPWDPTLSLDLECLLDLHWLAHCLGVSSHWCCRKEQTAKAQWYRVERWR